MRIVPAVFVLMLTAAVCSADSVSAEVAASINAGRYDDAIAVLRRDGARRELLLAVAYVGKGDLVGARREAESLLRQRPDDVAANYLLALILEEQREYKTAAERWKAVARHATDKAVRDVAYRHAAMMRLLQQ